MSVTSRHRPYFEIFRVRLWAVSMWTLVMEQNDWGSGRKRRIEAYDRSWRMVLFEPGMTADTKMSSWYDSGVQRVSYDVWGVNGTLGGNPWRQSLEALLSMECRQSWDYDKYLVISTSAKIIVDTIQPQDGRTDNKPHSAADSHRVTSWWSAKKSGELSLLERGMPSSVESSVGRPGWKALSVYDSSGCQW